MKEHGKCFKNVYKKYNIDGKIKQIYHENPRFSCKIRGLLI